jgi:thiamine-phosphate pyrophosphorylase
MDLGGLQTVRARRRSGLSGLYAIVDGSSPHDPIALVSAFLRGGARVVQLRLKQAGARELLRVAREAGALCLARGALLLVNDRPDVARLAGADGVHLGQDDLPVAEARAVVGEDALVGVSTHSDAEIDAAVAAGADYIGFGPIFATATKKSTAKGAAPLPPPHGPGGLALAVRRAGKVPVVAIGGITAANAAGLSQTGAACVAAIGELCLAPDPEARARALASAFGGGGAAGR